MTAEQTTNMLIIGSNLLLAIPTIVMAFVALHDMNKTTRMAVKAQRQTVRLLARLLGKPDPYENHKHVKGE